MKSEYLALRAPARLIGPSLAIALALVTTTASAQEEHASAVNDAGGFVIRSIVIGSGATVVMDLWAALLKRVGITSLNFALLGRWIGHLSSGRWFHENIAKAPEIRGELLIGWCAHYSIGISFAALLLATFGVSWARSPTLSPALIIGAVTVVAPWFILQPALGLGIASSRTPRPVFNAAKSLVTHLIFGVGLFVAAMVLTAIAPVRG